MALPADPDPRAFDALHDDPAAWRDVVESMARALGVHDMAAVQQESEGTVLVARLGDAGQGHGGRVLKLYPPFLRDHFEFERAMLRALHGRLRVPTPRLLASGTHEGWPYLVMSHLAGEPMTRSWPRLSEVERLALLADLGALTAEVHALPVGELASRAPRWPEFIAQQRARCVARQQRTGLPAHLLAAVPDFVAGPLPEGPPVLLTGEYTPMNLFTQGATLAAMFDFGDGLVGPREYDWLGPLCFLAAGHAERCAAFLGGCGVRLDAELRLRLLRLLLLHRYSNLPGQIACPGWQRAGSFEELAARIWPLPGDGD
ncbi:MAG: aminoglycoside 3'-phosphotransferase/choline kinase family protein [Rubrivivax sp.]|nr:aminoglycoside 3'-phosphotransferase/choline kinase family protein [Rubrivivax sp.]